MKQSRRGRTWQPMTQQQGRPKLSDEKRQAVAASVAQVVAKLKKRYCKPPRPTCFPWAENLFTRWHKDAVYFVVVMRTQHGQPPTFPLHVARMEHAGEGKFNLAGPMRRGWNTFKKGVTLEECLKEISTSIAF